MSFKDWLKKNSQMSKAQVVVLVTAVTVVTELLSWVVSLGGLGALLAGEYYAYRTQGGEKE